MQSAKDELDDRDKNELDLILSEDSGKFKWFDIGSQNGEKKSGVNSQFNFDDKRVFSAVYSRARDAREGKLGKWTDLPALAATEVFRNLLARENYDDLYLPARMNEYPLAEFQKKFSREVRNMGILGYQIIRSKDNTPLKGGQAWEDYKLEFSEYQNFKESAVSRDRGIKAFLLLSQNWFPPMVLSVRNFWKIGVRIGNKKPKKPLPTMNCVRHVFIIMSAQEHNKT